MKQAILVEVETPDVQNPTGENSAVIKIGKTEFAVSSIQKIPEGLDGLEELVALAKKEQKVLIIDQFTPFKLRKNLDKLKFLQESGVSFHFLDFQTLNKKTVSAVLDLLLLNFEEQSKKIREALEEKKKEGVVLGNPEIGNKEGAAVRKRQLLALINEANVAARRYIRMWLQEDAGLSLSQLAQQLNDMGLRTRRGQQFYPKTVQRLLESIEELRQKFSEDPKKGNLALGDLAGEEKELPIEGIHNGKGFEKTIRFKLTESLPVEIGVKIFDNQSENPVFFQEYPPHTQMVEIDLEDAILLPGTHYILIEANDKQYNIFYKSIQLYPSMVESVL